MLKLRINLSLTASILTWSVAILIAVFCIYVSPSVSLVYAFIAYHYFTLLYFSIASISERHNLLIWFAKFSVWLPLVIFTYAGIYTQFGIMPSGKIEPVYDFWTSIYFSIVTWTTLGYGDFSPVAELRIVAALQAMLGYLCMAIFAGELLALIDEQRRSKRT